MFWLFIKIDARFPFCIGCLCLYIPWECKEHFIKREEKDCMKAGQTKKDSEWAVLFVEWVELETSR
jgi:hypothetical protein